MSDPIEDVLALITKAPVSDAHWHTMQTELVVDKLPGATTDAEIEDLVAPLARLAGAQKRAPAAIDRPFIALFAAINGVGARIEDAQDQAYVQELIAQMQAGQAPAARVAQRFGAGVQVLDLASDTATPDITEQDSLTPRELAATFAFGMEALAARPDGLVLGTIAAGTTIGVAALRQYLGLGPFGPDLSAFEAGVLDSARGRRGVNSPLDALCAFGGRELAAVCGTIIGARFQNCAIILDGPVAHLAAALLERIKPGVTDHCFATLGGSADHSSSEWPSLVGANLAGLRHGGQPGLAGGLALQQLQALAAIA